MNPISAAILDESTWLTFSMGCAILSGAILLVRSRSSEISRRQRILATMNLFFGVTVGMMTFGHLLAVTLKLLADTLVGSPFKFYAIGLALALPSTFVLRQTRRILRPDSTSHLRTIYVNMWLGITLLALGLPNVPLAFPAVLNVAYLLHTRPAVGWAVVVAAVVLNVGLFIGSLVFLASGQTFEQFRGMQ